MFGWLTNTMAPEPAILDHVPVNGAPSDKPEPKTKAPGEGLSREEKLALAAQRHGKPFKDAAEGLPRIVIKDGNDVVVGSKPRPVPEPSKGKTVSMKARA